MLPQNQNKHTHYTHTQNKNKTTKKKQIQRRENSHDKLSGWLQWRKTGTTKYLYANLSNSTYVDQLVYRYRITCLYFSHHISCRRAVAIWQTIRFASVLFLHIYSTELIVSHMRIYLYSAMCIATCNRTEMCITLDRKIRWATNNEYRPYNNYSSQLAHTHIHISSAPCRTPIDTHNLES